MSTIHFSQKRKNFEELHWRPITTDNSPKSNRAKSKNFHWAIAEDRPTTPLGSSIHHTCPRNRIMGRTDGQCFYSCQSDSKNCDMNGFRRIIASLLSEGVRPSSVCRSVTSLQKTQLPDWACLKCCDLHSAICILLSHLSVWLDVVANNENRAPVPFPDSACLVLPFDSFSFFELSLITRTKPFHPLAINFLNLTIVEICLIFTR